ncbi:hypothetical protein BDV3_003150 [Batrachochytrium dendrobatidis]
MKIQLDLLSWQCSGLIFALIGSCHLILYNPLIPLPLHICYHHLFSENVSTGQSVVDQKSAYQSCVFKSVI